MMRLKNCTNLVIISIKKQLVESDLNYGIQRKKKLNKVEESAANGAAYLPVWLVEPRAWAQSHISTPEFDGNGQLLLGRLRRIKNEQK